MYSPAGPASTKLPSVSVVALMSAPFVVFALMAAPAMPRFASLTTRPMMRAGDQINPKSAWPDALNSAVDGVVKYAGREAPGFADTRCRPAGTSRNAYAPFLALAVGRVAASV